MKKGEKRVILILIIITVILIIVAVNVKKDKDTDTDDNANSGTEVSQGTDDGDNVDILEDGTKLNTSSALNETKTLDDGLEVSDIQLTENGNVTLLLATVTNSTGSTQGGYPINITFVDEEGNSLATLAAYIKELESGETTQLSTNTTFDYSEAYDFIITKQ